jgi:hypothetical protein
MRPALLLNALLLAGATACGPEAPEEEPDSGEQPLPTWMLGTWSNKALGFESGSCIVQHFKFEADGMAFEGRVGDKDCEDLGEPRYAAAMMWEPAGDDTVLVPIRSSSYNRAWRITPARDPHTGQIRCDLLRAVRLTDGVPDEHLTYTYIRGSLCVEPVPQPAGTYRTVWCDDPPPRCEDEDAF